MAELDRDGTHSLEDDPEEGFVVPLRPELKTTMSRTSEGAKQALRASSGQDEATKDTEHHGPAEKHIFVDAESMKAKVRQNLAKPAYNVRDYYKQTGMAQKIARSYHFEIMTLSVIAFNALWIAIDTDLNDATILLDAHPVFQIAENLFCAFFSFEWTMRFMAFEKKRSGLRDPWFVFDTLLVATMVLETWVMTGFILLTTGGSGGEAAGGNSSIMKVARLLRLSRMARMARLLRAMPELMILIKGMVAASRSVLFTLFLLSTFLYIFAIMFKQLTAESYIGEKYFSSVPDAMYNLLVYGAFMDSLTSIANEIKKESIVVLALFFFFVLLAALTVMNMLIGVLCEVVSAVAATEKEEMLVGFVNGRLRQVVQLLDEDGTMTISRKEFMKILENTDAVRCLQDVGVDVVGLVDFADAIFDTDDMDSNDEKELSFPDFMEVVLQLRGSNNATVKDIVDLRKFVRNSLIHTNSALTEIRSQMASQLRMTQVAKEKQQQQQRQLMQQRKQERQQEMVARDSSFSQSGVAVEGVGSSAVPAIGSSSKIGLSDAAAIGSPSKAHDETAGDTQVRTEAAVLCENGDAKKAVDAGSSLRVSACPEEDRISSPVSSSSRQAASGIAHKAKLPGVPPCSVNSSGMGDNGAEGKTPTPCVLSRQKAAEFGDIGPAALPQESQPVALLKQGSGCNPSMDELTLELEALYTRVCDTVRNHQLVCENSQADLPLLAAIPSGVADSADGAKSSNSRASSPSPSGRLSAAASQRGQSSLGDSRSRSPSPIQVKKPALSEPWHVDMEQFRNQIADLGEALLISLREVKKVQNGLDNSPAKGQDEDKMLL